MGAELVVKELILQRNSALDAVVNANVRAQLVEASLRSAYDLLASVIASGSLTEELAHQILSDKDFSEWYSKSLLVQGKE